MLRHPTHALRATRAQERRVDRLRRRVPQVGLTGVLADLDRTGTPCEVPGEAAGRGFAWEPRDADDPTWWPQGVASTASGDVLLVSWYARRRKRVRTDGSRITVVDRSDPERPRYRHVLLVVPRRWRLGTVPVHAGGIAVVGDLLYVADTIAGVRVFRLTDALRASSRGHDYVLPQLLRLRVPWTELGRLRWSFLSVGQVGGRLSLVAGEYRRQGATPRRLVRYLLDPVTALPAVDDDGQCRPVEVHADQPPRMQGVAVHGSTWYVSASAGEGTPGDLHVGAPGALRRHRGVLPTGPEDLAWSRPGEQLWCVSEWPGRRWVFPVDARRWDAD